MERRIAAILAGDMVGYSRLIELDETYTLARQRKHMLELIDPTIERMNGHIVKLTGDGMIAEFGSVIEAVQCAVAIQKEMAVREEDQPEDRRIQYRIAINLGDVVFENDDVFGDGVNIAARLEALAEPGGIVVSGTAFDLLKNHVDVGYLALGEKKLKNIATPVRVYQVTEDVAQLPPSARESRRAGLIAITVMALLFFLAVGWWWTRPDVEPADPIKFVHELPDKPSVAVLPFANIAGTEANSSLADGFVDLLITELSRQPDLFVIARSSSFAYRHYDTQIKEISETFGVRYVVKGSFQHFGGRILVSVQLIDGIAGKIVWSNRYDRLAFEFYGLLHDLISDLALEIGGSGVGGIFIEERLRVQKASNADLSAVELWEKASKAFLKNTREGNDQIREIGEEMISKAPNHSRGYTALGAHYLGRVSLGYSTDRTPDLRKCVELADKAVSLDASDYVGHLLRGACKAYDGKTSEAVSAIERSFYLNPNDVIVRREYARQLLLGEKRYYEAIEMFKSLLRVDPSQQTGTSSEIGIIYLALSDYAKAVEFNQREIGRGVAYDARLAASMWLNGQKDEARALVSEVLQKAPEFTTNSALWGVFWVPEDVKFRVTDALIAAGMPY